MEYLPVAIVFILYFSSLPIAFALFGASIFYFTFMDAGMPTDLVLQKFITATASFPLLAIPFFVMAGSVMNYSGISAKLMQMADVLTGHLTGGMAQVNVVLSTFMGGVSGSANADAAMQSKILVPQMQERGYSKAFSAAITAASSAISPVIPPGIVLIIYALIAQVSVAKMFAAGYAPGLIMAAALMITVAIISKKRGYKPTREIKANSKEIAMQFIDSMWSLALPFGVILGLRFGLFTPTEAGAIAVLASVLIGILIYKELKKEHFIPIMKDTIYGTGTVVLIIVSASVFGYYLNWEQIPQRLTEVLLSLTQNKYVMLAIMNVLLLAMGMFLEGGAALIIIAPLVVPVATQLGIDPIHFGAVLIVNIMIGGVTPPFGSMMFTTCSITGVTIGEFVKEIWPFIIALLLTLLLVTYWPAVVLFLPNLL
ncbi:TRAP transporter large permease [Halobacteriovorax vibrionivorans]|uniref:TRAP transporter large permease n=1 Tax=Halobacteriovorax vibrionivorans TaxID=2152716 RepID=A0ABY0IF80_9BACT|nr:MULTISPECIES: TRAP transporter large permease [Halobacteriovorax]RZF21598.1 TRAP transporter large permease [Halobacteriovorax vibrionivorans]TGD49109.1 TRAP transporter large permease [Halobacteriovorax sp. Y22]